MVGGTRAMQVMEQRLMTLGYQVGVALESIQDEPRRIKDKRMCRMWGQDSCRPYCRPQYASLLLGSKHPVRITQCVRASGSALTAI